MTVVVTDDIWRRTIKPIHRAIFHTRMHATQCTLEVLVSQLVCGKTSRVLVFSYFERLVKARCAGDAASTNERSTHTSTPTEKREKDYTPLPASKKHSQHASPPPCPLSFDIYY